MKSCKRYLSIQYQYGGNTQGETYCLCHGCPAMIFPVYDQAAGYFTGGTGRGSCGRISYFM